MQRLNYSQAVLECLIIFEKKNVYFECRVFDNIWEKKQSVYFECRVFDNIWEKKPNQFILSVQSVECLIIFEKKTISLFWVCKVHWVYLIWDLTFDYTNKLLGVVIPHKEQAYIVLQKKLKC